MTKTLRKIGADEFAKRLRAASILPDRRFAFFLGAGCSVSSGVPTTGQLVKDEWLPRLRDFCASDRRDLDIWTKEEFPDYEPKDPALSYGTVIQRLFLNSEERQLEVERLCEGKFPAFGYAVLATLVAQKGGLFNVVITTNFDDLVADALYLFTQARPLVIGHESLAGFIRPTRTRPLVVKLHGDFRLAPLNTATETEAIKKEVEGQVANLLHDRGLIIVGYGGNDQGIVTMLDALPKGSLPYGVYWVGGTEPQNLMRPWLENWEAIWVEKFDFDELMLLIRNAFGLPHPDQKPFEAVFSKYGEMYATLSTRILERPADTTEKASLKEAVERADKDLWGPLFGTIKAKRFEKSDPQRADEIYKAALDKYTNSVDLIGAYANFLHQIGKDYDKAEEYYRRALELDPSNAANLNNYANLLFDRRKDYDKAEEYYRRALELDPNTAVYHSNYAIFIMIIRKDYDKAEEYYRRALRLAPNDATALGSYANFLCDIRKDYDKAEEYYHRALGIDPNDANTVGNYASLLHNIRKEYDKAAGYYRRALEIDPNHSNNLGNYAGFLLGKGDISNGLLFLDRAIQILPTIDFPTLSVEVWFYAFAHWPEDRRAEALKNLKRALLEGARSPGWDLSANIERARKNKHPEVEWLEKLADVISEKADISILEKWNAWQKA